MRIQKVHDGVALVAQNDKDRRLLRRIENAKYPLIGRSRKVREISFLVLSYGGHVYTYHGRVKVH